MLAVLLAAVPVGVDLAAAEALRFVADPQVLSTIDPAASVAPPAPPAAAAKAVDAPESPAVAKAAAPAKPATASWPVTLQEVRERQTALANKTADTYSPDTIRAARAACEAILKRIDAVAVVDEPVKEGDCGTPAPIRLMSVGKKPEVVISPPALVTCEMAEAIHTWLKQDLQPLARKHLGAPLVKIEKMSDYSCRNAYGRAKGRLSEHGRVNALDIAGFTTARGDTTMLLADWGMTARDIRRQVAAAQAKAAAEQRQRLAAERQSQENARASQHKPDGDTATTNAALPPTALGITSGAPAGGVARTTIIDGVPRVTVSIPGASSDNVANSAFDPPSRLGGPKPAAAASAIVRTNAPANAAVEIGKQRFLRGAHETACRIFGTVLGPEANNAHRNHFHIDMAERGASGAFCQ